MRWDEERYVRLYKRDTADWLALSFDAQALFALLLRKVNLSGFLELGRHGPKAIAMVLQQVALWESRLKPALEELIADGCVRIDGPVLVMPNYVAAQTAIMSGKLRTRVWREQKAASEAATAHETQRHARVTPNRLLERDVTPAFIQPLSSQKELPPLPPATAGGAPNGAVLDLKTQDPERQPTNGVHRPPRLKTRKRHSAANVTLRQELRFREDAKRDQRSKALFAWLESERQGAKVLDVAKDELARVPGREPTREEQIAFVQEKCAATIAEAEDAVALVEAAQMAAKGIEKREAGHA